MKFQNPSKHVFFFVFVFFFFFFVERMHARMDNPKPICSRNLFEVGSINIHVQVQWTRNTRTCMQQLASTELPFLL